MTIQLEDFKAALDEVPPAFGISEDELQQCVQNHLLRFDERVQVNSCPNWLFMSYNLLNLLSLSENFGRW